MKEIMCSIEEGVATIRLCRLAKMNAISFEMWDEIHRLLLKIEHRDDVKCVLLQADGDNFSAGTDIGNLHEVAGMNAADRSATMSARMELSNRVFTAMERIPQIVVSSVRGLAAGAGFGIAVGADLVVASNTAVFKVATLSLGSIPDVGVPYQMAKSIGLKKAMQYCLTEEPLTAVMAADLGLINWVVEDEELENRSRELVETLLCMPQPALSLAKSSLNATATRSLNDHLYQEAVDVGRCVASPDYLANIEQFMNRKA